MTDLFCLGEPLVEFNQQPDGRFLLGFGGDVSNVAIAAARQGVNAAMLTRVGQDRFGDDLRRLWRDEGVADEHVHISTTEETGLYFVTHDAQGHHFTYRRRGSAASRYSVGDLPKDALTSAKMFYASGISLAIGTNVRDAVLQGFRIVKQAGGLCAFDPNLRTALWPLDQARDAIHAVMRSCDIALPGYDDAYQLTGLANPEDIVSFYHDLGASVVALTLGAAGVMISDGSICQTLGPVPVKTKDATGAGDCFNGAFLAALLRGLPACNAARWANAAAALSTCGFGAVAPIPTLSQTRTHLEQTGDPHDH
ncbi:sugar kinase [Ruegeria sp.]|uniref:sugar kinase n=1 Tax=Ruegeria sp. TaxID=1879320 RepID=UPI00231CF37A|nr:sugar kinase [Ruegeria sp.]MDA7963621.1 sugar kinase [Ruegeria sp.]